MTTQTSALSTPPAQPVGPIQLLSEDWLEAMQVRQFLQLAGLNVEMLRGHGAAVELMAANAAISAIIDISVGRAEALAALRKMRAAGWRTPVMLMAPAGEIALQVEGLEAGADQYVTKPFVSQELVARTRAMVRRGMELRSTTLRIGDLVLNNYTRQATRGGRNISLTQREYELLLHLMSSSGRICDRASILNRVWGYQHDPGTNIVDVYVRKLRDKIDSGQDKKLIHSVRGIGYIVRP